MGEKKVVRSLSPEYSIDFNYKTNPHVYRIRQHQPGTLPQSVKLTEASLVHWNKACIFYYKENIAWFYASWGLNLLLLYFIFISFIVHLNNFNNDIFIILFLSHYNPVIDYEFYNQFFVCPYPGSHLSMHLHYMI